MKEESMYSGTYKNSSANEKIIKNVSLVIKNNGTLCTNDV